MNSEDKIGTDIQVAVQNLQDGHLVGIPTETVYGLAAIATDEEAVVNIFKAKGRPSFDPLICHLHDDNQIHRYVEEIPGPLEQIIDSFMPGPVTVLLPKKKNIPDLVTSGLPRVAIRIPEHPITRELLRLVDAPLAAPSANPFGYISPTTAQHVIDQLGNHVNYVLDGGPCDVGVESTIVGMEDGQLIVYRKGGLAIEALQSIGVDIIVKEHSSSNPAAPGMLKSHYAPRTNFMIVDTVDEDQCKELRVGFLAFRDPCACLPIVHQRVLSPSGDYGEAAQNLFRSMRELDQLHLDMIYAQLLPEEDLGRAINDRLRRAAT